MSALESIKMQQANMTGDGILLNYAIKEGMADFINGLIDGEGLKPRLLDSEKEKEAIKSSKKKTHLKKLTNNKETRQHSEDDLAYWIGYQICQSYLDNADDKKQAIFDMMDNHGISAEVIRLRA